MLIIKRKFIVNIAILCALAGGLLFFQGSGGEVKADTKEVYKNIRDSYGSSQADREKLCGA